MKVVFRTPTGVHAMDIENLEIIVSDRAYKICQIRDGRLELASMQDNLFLQPMSDNRIKIR